MKKTIAILLVLVIGMVGVFAAASNTADLELNTSVAGLYGIYVGTTPTTATTPSAFSAEITSNTVGSSITFDNENLKKDLYVNFMTNQRIKAEVTVAAKPMYSSEGIDYIGYDVSVANGVDIDEVPVYIATSIPKSKTTTPTTITLFGETGGTSGLRFKSNFFSITMKSSEWDIASEGSYETDWVITLTVN